MTFILSAMRLSPSSKSPKARKSTEHISAFGAATLVCWLAPMLLIAGAARADDGGAAVAEKADQTNSTPSPQSVAAKDDIDPVDQSSKPRERARREYLGRRLAKPMSHLGAPWLIRKDRDEEENASDSFQQLKLKAGMTLCDLGCGNGYWTLPMARAVKPEGKVYAVDIQREMLQLLKARADEKEVDNIKPVLGTVDDPKLPAGAIDLLLMVDVYHEFSHPESMLWEIRRSLTSTGVVALLEYREEDPKVPIKPLHKMSKRQIMKEYERNGFKLVREYNELPWQHLMFFARDDSPLEKIEPIPAADVLKNLSPRR